MHYELKIMNLNIKCMHGSNHELYRLLGTAMRSNTPSPIEGMWRLLEAGLSSTSTLTSLYQKLPHIQELLRLINYIVFS